MSCRAKPETARVDWIIIPQTGAILIFRGLASDCQDRLFGCGFVGGYFLGLFCYVLRGLINNLLNNILIALSQFGQLVLATLA